MKVFDYLLIFVPASLALGYAFHAEAVWVFAFSVVAIVPLADWIRRGTEQLAKSLGSAGGGLLNVTFGNISELILAFFVLKVGRGDVVKAQITGSIIGNSLLGLGIAILTGSWGRAQMDTWSRGRVGLVGDSAFCPSLLAGQGSALAMIGAYVLAGELGSGDGSGEAALKRYESLLHPFVLDKQTAAEKFASSFTPKTRWGLFLRTQVTKAFAIPLVPKLLMGTSLLDRIDLPDYRGKAPLAFGVSNVDRRRVH